MKEGIRAPSVKTIGLSGYNNRKKQTLLTAARHNLRDIQKELGADGHIDPGRICLNQTLAGPDTPAGVVALAKSLMDGIGYTPKRKDYTQAHEVLITLPGRSTVEAGQYFSFCLDFIVAQFGPDAILSAIVHHDEAEPHLHVLLIPIAGGQYVGSSLITKPSLAELIDKFAADALKSFGIVVMTSIKGKDRARAAQMVDKGLRVALDGIASPALLQAILKAAARHPAPFMEPLELRLDDQLDDGGAAFRRIALSTGKGAKKERDYKPYGFEKTIIPDQRKPYGFEKAVDQTIETPRNHPCVVSAINPPLPSAKPPTPATMKDVSNRSDSVGKSATDSPVSTGGKQPPTAEHFPESIRVRDSDLDPALYDPTTGEYFKPPPKPARQQKQAADAWVKSALSNRQLA